MYIVEEKKLAVRIAAIKAAIGITIQILARIDIVGGPVC